MMQACASRPSLKQKVVMESGIPITSCGRTPVYQLNITEIPQQQNTRFRLFEYGNASGGIKRFEKVILIVGATGAGKTTLINSLVNYVFGVEFEDQFRLKLISETLNRNQSHSQTRRICAYTIHHQDGFTIPYTLTIIDTPGYGDTEGIQRDHEITNDMYEFFKSEISIVDHIDAVGFVAQASLPRLTIVQKYIFDSILALFSQDIAGNIFLLLTFADGQQPQILAAIYEARVPHQDYFRFNNSAMFIDSVAADDNGDDFNKMFWKLGMKSFKMFTNSLEATPTRSLKLTKHVLERRKAIEMYTEYMQQKVQEGLVKLKQLKIEEQLLLQHERDVQNHEHFEYEVEVILEKDEIVKDGFFKTMAKNLLSFVTLTLVSLPPRYQKRTETIKKTKTLAGVKARYEEACGKRMSVQQVIAAIKAEFTDIQNKVFFAICEIRESLKTLDRIALRGNPLSAVDYIDVMITNEQAHGGDGWQYRVQQLMTFRKRAVGMAQVATEDFDPFKEFADEYKQEGSMPHMGEAAPSIGPVSSTFGAMNLIE